MRVTLLLLSLLAACGSVDTQRQRDLEYSQAINSRCDQYGFKRGTPDFSNCVMRLDQQNRGQMQQFIMQQHRPNR